MALLVTWSFLALALVATVGGEDVDGFAGDVSSAAYSRWFYRWHRGGAFVAHEQQHPCWAVAGTTLGSRCSFLPLNAGGGRLSAVQLRVNTTIAPQFARVELAVRFNDGDERDELRHSMALDDVVAVYLVDADDRAATEDLGDFVDYMHANASRLVADASGESHVMVFGPLVNMRASYQFRYLRRVRGSGNASDANHHTFAVLGESPFVEMERGATEPLQIRLALTGQVGEMRVTWTSGRVFGANVRYRAARGGSESRAEAKTASYDADDMCSAPATIRTSVLFRSPGQLHDAVMTGLVPGKRYTYRVGSNTGVMSPELPFTFPTALGDSTDSQRPQSVFVFGDLGIGVLENATGQNPERRFTSPGKVSRLAEWDDEHTVMRRIHQDLEDSEASTEREDPEKPEYAAVVHIGDVSYAKGSTYLWDQFGALVEPVASRLAYMVGVGNHEYDYTSNGVGHDLSGSTAALSAGWHPHGGNFGNDSHGECGVPYARRFHMPDGKGNEEANPPFWYSFRVGVMHHVVLSSEHDCTPGAPMRQWLEDELSKRVNRGLTPWLIVHLHRPLYCSEAYAGDHKVAKLLRNQLEELLAASRVDLVFSGHYHAYERTCPVFQNECREVNGRAEAPTHIMVGSGGAELDDASYLEANWSRASQQEYGYGRLHVFNGSHAHFEFLRARDRVVSDSVWIVSTHDWDVTA